MVKSSYSVEPGPGVRRGLGQPAMPRRVEGGRLVVARSSLALAVTALVLGVVVAMLLGGLLWGAATLLHHVSTG